MFVHGHKVGTTLQHIDTMVRLSMIPVYDKVKIDDFAFCPEKLVLFKAQYVH